MLLDRIPMARVGTVQFSFKMTQLFSCGVQQVGNLLSGKIFSVGFLVFFLNYCQDCPPEGANRHRLGQLVARLFLSRHKSPNRQCRTVLGAAGAIFGYSSPTAKGGLHFSLQQP